MSIKLLIADDSVTIQKVVDLAFEDEDVSVFTAGDGQAALDKIQEIQPDIVIADTDMPKLNGFELCQKIKEDKELKKISFCLLHSDFEEFDEEEFRSCGADGHLSKPFKSEDIINKVSEITGEISQIIEESIFNDDLTGKNDIENREKLPDDLQELEILPLNEVEEEIEDGEIIELKSENETLETDQDQTAALESTLNKEPSENEIAKFMEGIKEEEQDELLIENSAEETSDFSIENNDQQLTDNLDEKLEEFNEVLNIPDEELGEVEPLLGHEPETESEKPHDQRSVYTETEGNQPDSIIVDEPEISSKITAEEDIKTPLPEEEEEKTTITKKIAPDFAEDKPEISDNISVEEDIKAPLTEQGEEKAGAPEEVFTNHEEMEEIQGLGREETSDLEPINSEISEEKEDLIEDAGILPGEEVIDKPDIQKIPIKEPSEEADKILEDDFERLIGGYIKQVIEKILKEAIQNEIAGITDKIIEAVEKIAREITPDISKTIIQKEINKQQDSQD